jgi:hypothetical protein
MFGVASTTWLRWQREWRVTSGQSHQRPSDGHTCILYPVAELERLREEVERIGQPYPDTKRPGVWRVPLNGYGPAREALVDERDLPIVQGVSRCWSERSNGKGGTVVLTIGGRQKHLHRLVGEAMGVAGPGAIVRFANGDPLDCRRQNLVVRTRAQVGHSRRPSPTRDGRACTSTLKGVTFDKRAGRWRATIRRGEVETSIGAFDDERAAAEAYDDAARVWFGGDAYLNFPDRASTDEKRAWAQALLDRAMRRERRRARRVKKLARLLKREARARTSASDPAAPADGPTISRGYARNLLGVPRAKWRRWEKRGWIASRRRDGDGRKVYPVALIKRLMEACGRLRPPYPDPQRADVWRVPLAFSGERNEVLIDASSLALIGDGWCMMSGMRAETGADAYVSLWSPATKEHRPLRRLIAGVTDDGTQGGLQVGHRNDDPMDCRRANLVVVTPAQRSYRNRKIKSRNGQPTTSEFKGVSWHKKGKKWTAMIHGCGTHRYLGMYVREEEAALAYDRAARELYGEHARLNFPDGIEAWLEREAA